MIPDHYQVLGIHPGATVEEIQAAYHRVMRANHPDHRPGDEQAAETARRANAAWRVLRVPNRRAAADLAAGIATPAPLPRVNVDALRAEAYSPAGAVFRRAVHRTTVRVAAAVFAAGLSALAALT